MFIVTVNTKIDFQNSQRFYLFLLVHAAYADYQMHSKEVHFILQKLKELLGGEDVDVYDEFLELKDLYEDLSNEDIEQLVRENYPRYLESVTRRELLSWLSGVIKADGIIRQSEMDFFSKVKAIIEDPIIH